LGIGTQVTQCSATGRATFSVPEALDLSDEGVPVILVGSVDFVIYNFRSATNHLQMTYLELLLQKEFLQCMEVSFLSLNFQFNFEKVSPAL
jgi:hypothetical protein